MRNHARILVVLVFCTLFVQACKGPEPSAPPGTTPIRQLIAEKRSPIEVVSFRPEFNPVVRRFKLVLKNISDKPVMMVHWTQLFFAQDGSLLPAPKRDGGCSELTGIAPGETYEGVMLSEESAVRGSVVIRAVTYESLPEGAENNPSMRLYKLNFQWKNPDRDSAVRALLNERVPSGTGARI